MIKQSRVVNRLTNKKQNMSKLSEKYWSSTPKIYRAIGDTLLALGSIAAGYNILEGNQTWAIIVLVASVLGKFLTNFATENEQSGTTE